MNNSNKYPIEESIYLKPKNRYMCNYGKVGVIIGIKNVQFSEHSSFKLCYKILYDDKIIDLIPMNELNTTFKLLTVFDMVAENNN